MAQNLLKLASQGRAYDGSRAWTEEELVALITLERERGLLRSRAAMFVRNGVKTLKAYDAATEAGFEPKSLEDLRAEAIAAYTEKVRGELGLDTTEEVVETTEVIEPKEVVETEVPTVSVTDEVFETEEVVETTEVIEPEEEIVEDKKGKNKAAK